MRLLNLPKKYYHQINQLSSTGAPPTTRKTPFTQVRTVRAGKVISDIKIRRDVETNESATPPPVIGQGKSDTPHAGLSQLKKGPEFQRTSFSWRRVFPARRRTAPRLPPPLFSPPVASSPVPDQF